MGKIKVSPSILAANFADLKTELSLLSTADMLHIDVMDGHFVPNISLGTPVIDSINKATDIFLDVHLMIANPINYVASFAAAGADLICFHTEASSDITKTIEHIREFSILVGLALKPSTPAKDILPYLDKIDMILVMTVEPGFGGQSFMNGMLEKIAKISQMIKLSGRKIMLQVDGGINLETAVDCVENGADVLVAGTYILGSDDPSATIKRLQEL